MTEQRRKIMVDSSIGTEDNISKQKNLPPAGQHKMNRNYSTTVEACFSYLRLLFVLSHSRYRSVSTSRPHRKSILPWLAAYDFPYVIFLLAFACVCIPLNAVSGEHSSAIYDSSKNFNTNSREPTSNKPCSKCSEIDLEALANITLQKIKTEILQRLGFLNGAPNATNFRSKMPPADMLSKIPSVDGFEFTNQSSHIRHQSFAKYRPSFMQNDEARLFDDGDNGLNRHMVVAKAKEVSVNSGYPKRPLLFTFESLSKSRVTNARLLLYQKAVPKDHSYSRAFKLTVIKILPKGLQTTIKQFDRDLSDNSGWIDFDFEPEVALKHFKNENGDSLYVNLLIYARFIQQNTTAEVPFITETKKCENTKSNELDCTNVPYLQLELEEPKNRRNKRSTYPDCRPDTDNYNNCCRYPLVVDFEAFKWDFIIAPKRYNAHYCAGECNYLSQQKNVHAHVVAMSQTSENKIPLCCGPRSMTSITMLYFNSNNNIVYGVLPGMVVERCGCQ